jgi:hypothetical protein
MEILVVGPKEDLVEIPGKNMIEIKVESPSRFMEAGRETTHTREEVRTADTSDSRFRLGLFLRTKPGGFECSDWVSV